MDTCKIEDGMLCISIPSDLQNYRIISKVKSDESTALPQFGVKFVKNNNGELEHVAYYSDSGELIKKIYYQGSFVTKILHYRDSKILSGEDYQEGLVKKKTVYDSSGDIASVTSFEYNKSGAVLSIKKQLCENKFEVQYGYDELNRVNKRKIIYNSKVIDEQIYKFDILDRIVEYKDYSQTICVNKLTPKNKLINYVITDKIGNKINVLNKFLAGEYIGTEIDLNGHKTCIKSIAYTDNILLKNPYTTEDDLELAISILRKKEDFITTKRSTKEDITQSMIQNRLQNNKPIPITMRKRLLVLKS